MNRIENFSEKEEKIDFEMRKYWYDMVTLYCVSSDEARKIECIIE